MRTASCLAKGARLKIGERQRRAVLVLRVAPVRLAGTLGPLIEHRPDAGGGREVFVDEVEDELGRVGIGGGRVADAGEVRVHLGGFAKVRHPAHGEDHDVVEAREDGGGELVDGAHDRDVLSLGDVLEEGHHAHRRRGVDAGRGLVQEENLRPFDQRERDGEPPLVARGQAADDLAARARVLKLLEADGVEELVHLGGALGDVEVAAVQRHGVLEVFLAVRDAQRVSNCST